MQAKIAKYHFVFKTSVMEGLVYIIDFIGRSAFFTFIMCVYLLLWKSIYSTGGKTMIKGFSLEMMIWYLVVTEIVTLSTTDYYKEVSDDIKSGNIAYLLNKPYDYITYCFFNHMGKISLRLLVNIVIGSITALVLVGPLDKVNPYSLLFVLISIVLGIVLNFFLNFSLALTAFWFEENMPFRWIFQKLVFTLGGMLLPLEMLPKGLGDISKNLPFAYITYAPGKLFVDFSMDYFFRVVFGQFIYLTLSIIICFSIYKKGVAKLNVNGG